MKNPMRTLRLTACALCLTAVLYDCKPTEVASLTPFTYTFKGLDDLKLPDVKPSEPVVVTVIEATVTPSKQAAAVSDGIAAIAATGKVPETVQQAVSELNKAIPEANANALEAGFTEEVINTLTTKGTLPADLQSQVDKIADSPMMKAYLPTFSLPQVDGKAVNARSGAAPETLAVATALPNDNDKDKCKKAAKEAFDKAVAVLDATRKEQANAIEAAYKKYEANANSERSGCLSGTPAKYNGLIATAKKDLDKKLADLKASKKAMGEAMYKTLTASAYVTYSELIDVYNKMMNADTKACELASQARVTAAKAARDKDLGIVYTNYNAVLKSAEASRDKAVASCHNQGNGG